MKNLRFCAVVLCLSFALSSSLSAREPVVTGKPLSAGPVTAVRDTEVRHNGAPVTDSYIIVLQDEVADVPSVAAELAKKTGGHLGRWWRDALKGFVISVPASGAAKIAKDPRVRFVEENGRVFLSGDVPTRWNPSVCDGFTPIPQDCATADDPLWHLDRLDQNNAGLDGTRRSSATGKGVLIYVIDTGVWGGHSEFAINNGGPWSTRVLPGYNAYADGQTADDPCHGSLARLAVETTDKDTVVQNSHGTAVASMAAGRKVGVAPEATIVPVKIGRCTDLIPRLWAANQAVGLGDVFKDYIGRYFQAVRAGTTGPPSNKPEARLWPEREGEEISDGTVIWKRIAYSPLQFDPVTETATLLDGLDWIVRGPDPARPDIAFNPDRARRPAVATMSTWDVPGFDGKKGSAVENAIDRIIAHGITFFATANNQGADACLTSPARHSRSAPAGGTPGKVITVGGTMTLNSAMNLRSDGMHFDNHMPARDARWKCIPGTVDADTGDSTPCHTEPLPVCASPCDNTAYGAWRSQFTAYAAGSNTGACVSLFAPAKNLSVAYIFDPTSYRNRNVNADPLPLATGQQQAAFNGTLAYASGTSFAAPMAAGMAARWLQSHPTDTPDQVFEALIGNATVGALDPETIGADSPNLMLHESNFRISRQPGSVLTTNGVATMLVETVPPPSAALPLEYQWYKVRATVPPQTIATAAGWFEVSDPVDGANSAQLSVNQEGLYWVRIKSDCCVMDSNVARLEFGTNPTCHYPTITAQPFPASRVVTPGQSVTITTSALDAGGYQWFEQAGDAPSVALANATTSTLTLAAGNVTKIYWAEISGTCGKTIRTEPVAVVPATCSQPTPAIAVDTTATLQSDGTHYRIAMFAEHATRYELRILTADPDATCNHPECQPQSNDSGIFLVEPLGPATTYWIVARNSCGDLVEGTHRTVTTCAPGDPDVVPAISMLPSSGTTSADGTVELTLQAPGLPNGDPDARVEWHRNGVVLVTSAPGFTFRAQDSGSYSAVLIRKCSGVDRRYAETNPVTVTIGCGGITPTTVSAIEVRVPEVSPGDPVTFELGTSVALHAAATGSDVMHYTWYFGERGDTSHPAENTVRLDTPQATAAQEALRAQAATTVLTSRKSTKVWVRVSGDCGIADSPAIDLQCLHCGKPRISRSTSDSTVPSGTHVLLSADEASTPSTYAWRTGTSYDITGDVIGTGASIDVAPTETTTYWVRVTDNATGAFADSEVATIVVVPVDSSVSIALFPSSQVPRGETAVLTASLAGGTYEWHEGSTHAASPVIGTRQAISVTPAADTWYWVRVADSGGIHISEPVRIGVCDQAQIVSSIAASGATVNDYTTISLSVAASGSSLSYQWQRSFDGSATSFVDIAGATSATYSVALDAAVSHTYYFRVRVTSCGSPVTSDIALFTVIPCDPPQFDLVPSGYTPEFPGDYVYLSAHANGSGVEYQWYHGITNPQPIGAWSTSGTLDNWQLNTDYDILFVRARTSCGATVDSPKVYVRILGTCDFPPLTVESTSVSVVPGGLATLTATTDWGYLTFQWYDGMSGDTRHPLQGVADHPNRLSVGSTARTYWVRATGECGTYADSATISVRVVSTDATPQLLCAPIVINGQPASQEIASGQSVNLAVNATATPEITAYQWYRGTTVETATPLAAGLQITVAPTITSTYFVRASSSCAFADTVPATLHVTSCSGLTINAPPQDTQVASGASASFSIAASGGILSYQWYLGESGDDSNPISGATSATFVTGPLAVGGTYWVRISSSTCIVDSRTAHVCIAPSITRQPFGADLRWMQRAHLFVQVAGTSPFTYQWYDGEAGDTSHPLGTLSQIGINAAGVQHLWVRVTGCGGTVDSQVATVTGCNLAEISTQPQSPTIHSGETTTLSIVASQPFQSPTVQYQWYRGTVGDKSTPVGTGTSYTTPALTTTTNYWVAVTAGACETDSNQVTVSMCALPSMTVNGTTNVHKGDTITISVFPNPGTGGITYQWYEGAPGDTSSPRTSQTAYATSVQPLTTTSYWCRVTNGTCSVDSAAITVNVCIPRITTQPTGSMINSGQSLSLSVVSDLPAASTYQWYRGNAGDTGNPIAGATLASYIASPTVTTSYWVRVTGSCGLSVDSTTTAVPVCVTPAITNQPSGASITRGQTVNLTVAASGTGLTYQWYQGAGTSSPYGGGTSATLTMAPQSSAAFWCRVTGTCGTTDSNSAQVDVCSAPILTTQPQSQTINSGQTATLSVVVQANALNPSPHYHWYRGSVGDRSNVVGGDASSFTTPSLTTATSYWVAVNAGNCETVSSGATISMCALPAVTATGPTSIHKGDTITISLSPNPGTSGISYQWYVGNTGDTSSPIGSATLFSVTVQPQATTTYWCRVTSATCAVNSTALTASVCIPHITTQPAGNTINNGQSWTMTVASDVAASTFQWYRGNPGTTTSPVSGATATSLTISPTSTTTYFARITGSCGQYLDSNAATITICAPPAITGNPSGASITRGQTVNLTVTATGTGLTYQWYQGAGTSSPYGGGGQAATLTATPQVPTAYWCRVTGSCGTADSSSAQVNVCTTPTISAQPLSQTIADGGTATLSVTAAEATGLAMHYQWYRSTSGNPTNPVGTDSSTYTTATINSQTSYFVRITSGACTYDSATATITTCPLPVMQTTGGGSFPRYQSILLHVTPAPSDSVFAFYEGPIGDTSNFVGGGGIQSSLYITATHNAQYWARVDNGTCHVDTSATSVTVY